jgi:hypothetical protein
MGHLIYWCKFKNNPGIVGDRFVSFDKTRGELYVYFDSVGTWSKPIILWYDQTVRLRDGILQDSALNDNANMYILTFREAVFSKVALFSLG